MKRFFALGGVTLLLTITAAAQSTSPSSPQNPAPGQSTSSSSSQTTPSAPAQEAPPPPETPPYQLSGGFTLRVFTEPSYARVGLSGGYGSFDYTILSRISAAAEVSAAFRDQGFNGNLSIYSVMVGPQIYPFRHRRKFTPFAHVLFGEGFYRDSYPAYGGFPASVKTDSSFSWEVGGGLDLTHSSRWAIRLIQVDYAQTKFLGTLTQANYRASLGIVYRFAAK